MKNEIAENAKQEVEKILEQVKQERDEIVLKAHLWVFLNKVLIWLVGCKYISYKT